jgi:hypothetical protein
MAGLLTPVDPDSIGLMDSLPSLQYQQPQPGLLSRISGALSGALTNNPLLDMGLGIMASAGQLGGGVGAGAMQGAQMYRQQRQAALQQQLGQQQLLQNQLQMQMLRARMPGLLQYFNSAAGLMGGPADASGAPSGAGAPSGLGGVASAPQSIGNALPGVAQMSPAPSPTAAPMPSGTPSAGAAPGASDPFAVMRLGAMGSIFGAPGASSMLDYGKQLAQYDPTLATRLAAAKSPLAVAQAQYQQALTGTDPAAVQRALTNLRNISGQQHIGSMSGILTTQLPNGSWATVNPSTGLQTVINPQLLANAPPGAQWLPGELQAIHQRSAAEATGEAEGQVERVTDSAGNEYYVPKSALLGGSRGSAGSAAPQSGNGSAAAVSITPFQAAVGPATAEMLKGNAEQATATNKEYQDQAETGTTLLAQIQQLRDAAADMGTGKFEPARQEGLNILNSLGLISSDDLKRLGSAQEGTKLAIQLQAMATKQLGSREAAQIFEQMGKSMPNLTLSSDGLEKISAYLGGIARYQMARAQVAQQYQNRNNWQGVNSVRNDFIQRTDPTYYIVASAAAPVQREMIASMRNPRAFVAAWNKAANAGYAPRPGAYQ